MRKKVVTVLASITAMSMLSVTCMADGNEDYLTMIPNYDNEVGTFAQGPNGRRLFRQGMWN